MKLPATGMAVPTAALHRARQMRGVSWLPRELVPGLLLVLLVALAAAFLSGRTGAPVTLTALLVGLSLNFLESDSRLSLGLEFASRTLLRWGIVLLGARITLEQVAQLGFPALGALTLIVALTMLCGVLAARRFGFRAEFGLLAAGSVAICGASAAMAISNALGERRVSQSQLALVLVAISAFSALGMFLYPLICHWLKLDDVTAGFVLGASIHDVAQALGAGYGFSADAGQTAAIVKLSRVAMLAPILAIIGCAIPREDGRGGWRRLSPPWFVLGFFCLGAANSFGFVPPRLGHHASETATMLLVGAVAATGIRSRFDRLIGGGWRPFLVIALPTCAVFGMALAAVPVIQFLSK